MKCVIKYKCEGDKHLKIYPRQYDEWKLIENLVTFLKLLAKNEQGN